MKYDHQVFMKKKLRWEMRRSLSDPQHIEKKWQKAWEQSGVYWAQDDFKKKKSYILVEFPYPSGEGLHVGHCRPYIAFDVLSRKRRMDGFNVIYPMGWDAFGLPTENYAVKTGVHPKIATKKNTSFFKRQQKSIGLSFDWSREINTTDTGYYKWTQWIFLQLFKHGLAYKKKMPINWCPSCKIGLAAEEVVEGSCERCGTKVTKKEKEQWLLKITKYAERLIKDLDKVDYPEKVKTLQKDWIGKSEGVEIKFKVKNLDLEIPVFTTRADTLFGATYLVLAPEHPIIENYKSQAEPRVSEARWEMRTKFSATITNYKHVEKYVEEAKGKTERERISEVKDKTGIELKGVRAINPANGREIPIWVADYVLYHYGTGAIMAVPAHDERDFDFAKKYNLPIINVIRPPHMPSFAERNAAGDETKSQRPYGEPVPGRAVPEVRIESECWTGEGTLINSGRFTGMKSEDAKERIGEWLEKKGSAKKLVHYKLRDWIFSRQRYWGEPIPLILCEKCALRHGSGQGWVAVPEKDLPVKLPNVKDYKPTERGESPLAKVKSWVNIKCPKCKGPAKRETDVMPNWAGSNWYFLRYCDPRNDKKLAEPKKLKYWMPVDWYNGGMEHSTLHLLYSRFIYKFLWDIGAVPKSLGPEPYKKRTSHGVILGESGSKMSKSRGNVITPDEVIKQYGADTLRIYEMFMGPFGDTIAWDTKGVKGAERFLGKVWELFKINPKPKTSNSRLERLLHKTIKKVSEDIENLRFNTAVSSMMILVNEMSANKEQLTEQNLKILLLILAPFAPHITEELWQKLGNKTSIHTQSWLKYDSKLIKEETFTLVIQVSGRVRDKVEVETGTSENKAKELVISREKVRKWIGEKEVKKVIFVPGKLINLVV